MYVCEACAAACFGLLISIILVVIDCRARSHLGFSSVCLGYGFLFVLLVVVSIHLPYTKAVCAVGCCLDWYKI